MPDFVVLGDAVGVAARAGVLRSRGGVLVGVGEALGAVSMSGWVGRAADRFRENFVVEPQRWRSAGEGWLIAAEGLEVFAGALVVAQNERCR